MVVRMTATIPEIDTSILESLDFEFVQPCEHPRHSLYHKREESAMFLIERLVPCCGMPNYFICLSGWEHLWDARYVICMFCGTPLGGSRDEVLRIIRVIGT